MECNKDEAIRAKNIAVTKMEANDFVGAQKIALKAKNLYPDLENINQLLSICEVHCSAQKKLPVNEKDWYGILQVDRLADEATLKKQYRRLALILHPDKNRFHGAEAAFKLISEANVVLSDPVKKSVYDSKIRVNVISAPPKPPPPKKQAQKNVSSSVNQPKAARSNSSTFWTCCPYCTIRYQYSSEALNKSLTCQKCRKSFMAYDIGAQAVPTAFKPGAQNVPSKPDSGRPAASTEKVAPDQGKFKTGVQNDKGTSGSHAGSQGIPSKKTVRSEAGTGSEGIGVADTKVSREPKAKETVDSNAKFSHSGKEGGGTSNGDAAKREEEAGDLKNKSRKRGRKQVVDSSESCDASTESDLEDVTMSSDASRARFVRRSSRKRQNVSYNENDGKEQTGDLGSNENSVPTKSESKETTRTEENTAPADTVVIESDSDQDSLYSNDDSDKDVVQQCPDPEFSDFDKEREESRFAPDQFWALYDTLDSMPRFYARVRTVSTSPFEVSFQWLEAVPIDESYEEWVDEELPVGCGSFKMGENEKTSATLTFSHQVNHVTAKGKRKGSRVTLYPNFGEVWAVFKDWDRSWSTDPENHKKDFKYEIVEVVSDFREGTGVNVCYLDKVSGFFSIFQRSGTNSFLIGPTEVYKFSHRVPSFKMTGSEREGVPVGSFELDPLALPKFEDLYYPSKVKVESHVNVDSGVGSSLPNSDKKKGKSVVFEDTSTPQKSAGSDGISEEKSSKPPRRSPRVSSVNRQN